MDQQNSQCNRTNKTHERNSACSVHAMGLIRVFQYSQLGWIIKFENKARKNYKPQYTNVFEDLEFLQ